MSQEFNLDGRGKIQVQGVEDGGPRAVTGGTGDFRDVRGEATGFDFSNFLSDGEFTGTFELEIDDDDDDDDSDEEMLGSVALAPSIGSVGSVGSGAISWLMLAIGSAFGLLVWMRR